MVTAVTLLGWEDRMICETRTEGCHLKSHDICGITPGIYFTAGRSGRAV